MKKITKLFALALSSVLALSLFAACGGETGGEGGSNQGNQGNTGNQGGTGEEERPKTDKTLTVFADSDAALTVDGTEEKAFTVSDSLFGVFLEDINYAGYLLDGSLIANGSFESLSNKKAGWTEKDATFSIGTADGVLAGDASYAAEHVNESYASLNVTAAGGGLATTGHTQLPIAVKEGVSYTFSAFVRSTSATTMTVRLRDAATTYAEKSLVLKSDGKWTKYTLTLTSSGTADSGVSFELAFDAAGKFDVDGIALETSEQTGGIKQYVFDAIQELGPKFVRFPGGCIIEGDAGRGAADTQYIYDWKNSIGAVQNGENEGDDTVPAFSYTLVGEDGTETQRSTYGERITRRLNGDLWGNGSVQYDLEYGIGFYEFFLLCENLGASAVPVLNCGLSDHNVMLLNGRHGKGVSDYIQDAIDLIEFAKGDETTTWGKIRAQMGHPEPFEMDYVGIGNEQVGPIYYQTCYEEFLKDADFISACEKYGVKTIVGNDVALSDCQNTTILPSGNYKTEKGDAQRAAEEAVNRGVIDKISDFGVHDQHYYVNWTTLLENYDMYNEYAIPALEPDIAYGVFVGEYSANTPLAGFDYYENQLIAALSEAAMMTAYERHGNVIELAAYAPMFGVANTRTNALTGGNNDANQWDVDMMYFTNTQIVRTANYYVQQMFMQNTGTYYLRKSSMRWTSEETFVFPSSTQGAAGKTFNKLYYVASKAENGDILVKLVNVSGEAVKLNLGFKNATAKGYAYVTELFNADFKALNTLQKESVKPVGSTVGWEGESFGYEVRPYSLTVLRIPTSA